MNDKAQARLDQLKGMPAAKLSAALLDGYQALRTLGDNFDLDGSPNLRTLAHKAADLFAIMYLGGAPEGTCRTIAADSPPAMAAVTISEQKLTPPAKLSVSVPLAREIMADRKEAEENAGQESARANPGTALSAAIERTQAELAEEIAAKAEPAPAPKAEPKAKPATKEPLF